MARAPPFLLVVLACTPSFQAQSDVNDLRILGSSDYSMRIWVKPDQLARLNLTVADV